MHTKSDAELVADYAKNGSDDAFTELVCRYAPFVYSAAFRQLGSRELAQDVAQSVFSDLARKASSFRGHTVLIGWLHKAARLSALHQLRIERRRGQREQHAMEWHESSSATHAESRDLAPLLDEALSHLGQSDREAVLVRFFKDQSYSAVGAALGISEAAAQKRVSRSLEKLRTFFSRRGLTTTTAIISATLATTAEGISGPLVQSLAANALSMARSAPVAGAPTFTTKMITPKFAISAALVAATLATLAIREHQHSKDLAAAQALIQSAAEEAQQLRVANAALSAETDEIADLKRQVDEVLTLRAEVARLRRAQKTIARKAPVSSQPATDQTENPTITIFGQFLSVATDELNAVPWIHIQPGALSVIQSEERTNDLKLLKGFNGTELLSSPQVQTSSGIEARLFTGQTIPIDGTNAPVGISLSVNPHFTPKSSTVNLDIQTQVSLTKSTAADPTELNMTAMTNSVTLSDGDSVLLRSDIQPGLHLAGSTNADSAANTLIVLLTPRIQRDRSR